MTAAALIRKLLDQGHYLQARAESEKLIAGSENLQDQQLHALALSKAGTPQAAIKFFEPIHQQHPEDAESSGILGSIYKELFRQTTNQKYALLSRDAYLNNFKITRNYYTGINAATMSSIAGKTQVGREIAQEVLNVLPASSTDYWEIVTQAEARLLMKDPKGSTELYFKAHNAAGSDWGKINSVYNQLWLLNHYLRVPGEILKEFSPPSVAVFVGHMIDHPQRQTPRFPAPYAATVKDQLADVIKSINIRIGYTSLACGSDILFAEVLQNSGGEVNLFLPFKKEDFLKTSVGFAGDEWIERFEKIASLNTIHFVTQEGYLGNDDLFSFHGRILFGLAILRGRMLHVEPYLVTVLSEWDRTLKEGGTRDLMKLWPFPSRVQNIDPSKLFDSPPPREKAANIPQPEIPGRSVAYMAALKFEGPIMAEARRLAKRAETELAQELKAMNYEGEIIYAGFTSSYRAISFTKNMIQEILRKSSQSKYWAGLHAGPVVISRQNEKNIITGTHFEILKNIFSLAAPDTIFATESFAASLVLDSSATTFIHTGTLQLGEPMGDQNLYRID